MGVERLERELPLGVRWVAFPLHPETPEEGRDLADLFAGRGVDLPALLARLGRVAADLGLPLGERRRTYNSRRAHELEKWAETLGRGREFRAAAFRACFAYGRNLARPEVLADAADAAGLPAGEVAAVLAEGRFAAAVDGDWARARAQGVRAVPTHLLGARRLEGFAPPDELLRFARGAPT